MAEPTARSPIPVAAPEQELSGWLVTGRVSRAALTITDCTPLAKVVVKASYDGPMARRSPYRSAGPRACATVLLAGSGPGEWLALGLPGSEQSLAGWLTELAGAADELVTVVDLTHGRALLRLTGSRAAEVLAHECALDLGALVTGTALRTAVAGVATDIVRDDRAGPAVVPAALRAVLGPVPVRGPAGRRGRVRHRHRRLPTLVPCRPCLSSRIRPSCTRWTGSRAWCS